MDKFFEILMLRFIDDKTYRAVIAFILMIVITFTINVDRKYTAEKDAMLAKVQIIDKLHIQMLSTMTEQNFNTSISIYEQLFSIIDTHNGYMLDIFDTTLSNEQQKAIIRRNATLKLQLQQLIEQLQQQKRAELLYYEQLKNQNNI